MIGSAEDPFLLGLLQEINHIVQELTNRGEDPLQVFASIIEVGDTLNRTSGEGFYADVQRIAVAPGTTLFLLPATRGVKNFLARSADAARWWITAYWSLEHVRAGSI